MNTTYRQKLIGTGFGWAPDRLCLPSQARSLAPRPEKSPARSLQIKSASAEVVYVVVAANDSGVGAKIEDKDIEILKLPGSDLPPGCLSRKSQVIGSGVILPIAKREFIRRIQLTATNDFRLSALYSKGDMRAVPK